MYFACFAWQSGNTFWDYKLICRHLVLCCTVWVNFIFPQRIASNWTFFLINVKVVIEIYICFSMSFSVYTKIKYTWKKLTVKNKTKQNKKKNIHKKTKNAKTHHRIVLKSVTRTGSKMLFRPKMGYLFATCTIHPNVSDCPISCP